ncbi:putative molecular chaperone (DnaJ superfamily) [Phytophthora cinnamomi]|uniref:putative molecular chaperone (DnaJ superfamily) n=1 Tax=Phytophthora cinnamomi TaxID=4785 RepID=UPI00355A3309|nr:putative molecular chaperone (DnaJ superfamily) [Phytophthora cinnamomi]
MAEEEPQEWAAQAEGFKAEGNRLLAAKQFAQAADMYSRALELDPDNAVYYSNRSAAFLAMGDARGKALKDAEKCIELKPDWWKGYSRKGAAEHALLRFDAARATYNEGLKLDPDNASLLRAAEEAYAAGQEHSRQLREQAKEQERLRKEAEVRQAAKEEEERKKQLELEEKKKNEPKDDDALLAEFMSEVQELEESANCVKKDAEQEQKKKDKPPVDFGTVDGQIARLLQPHFKWINLNPFKVLMLDVDATEEDMKQHYRKISTMVHPDKCRNPKAREAFEETKKAYNLITQEDRRKTIIRTIENATEEVEKERRQKIKKGVKESELGDLNEAVEKAVMRAFAEIENRRLNIEKREAAQRRREAEQEEKEQAKVVNMFKRERSWAETDRREQRVGNWRSFQKDGKRRKEMDAQGWREEKRDEKKFGEADNDAYKRGWK